MRGAQSPYKQMLALQGIIPADAGSTEGYKEQWCTATEGGSSPRMRGAHPNQVAKVAEIRIIPADAGSTA